MMLPLLLLMALRLEPAPEAPAYRQPHVAAAHGQVAMAFGAGSSIYFSASADGGRTFGTPVKVAETGALALGRHRGPRVAILRDAIVISAIRGEKKSTGAHAHGLPENGDLAVWRSIDRGRTWKRTGVINDVPGAAREGLHAMAADPKGNLFAVWLDLRAKGTQLYGARSTDGGVTWSKNALVYSSPEGTICQCCHPSLAIDEKGRILVMWRNVVEGSRDLYVASSTDGAHFEAARKVGAGSWKINACPMDGGGMAMSNGRMISAWRRESDVYLTDGDGAEKRVGTGKDVALAVGRKGTYVAWTKGAGLEVWKPGATAPVELAAEGGFTELVALPDGGVLAVWEARNSIEAKRID
jgi:hypothetical protein